MKPVILLVSILFFSSSLLYAQKQASLTTEQQEIIKGIVKSDETIVSYKTELFDLDKDGQNEAIIIFQLPPHLSGAEVIRFNKDKADTIFYRTCSTPSTEFKVIDGIPSLIFTESDYTPDYARGKWYKEVYQWNGKTFSPQSMSPVK